jgi:Flp pilus assembly protein TadD
VLILLLAALLIAVTTFAAMAGRPAPVSEVRQLLEQGDPTAALERAGNSGSATDDAEVRTVVATARQATGDLSGAEADLERAVAYDADQPLVQHDLAVLAAERGDYDRAEEALRAALEVDPSLVGSRVLLGDVLARQGDREGAALQYQTIIDAQPYGVDLEAIRQRLGAL